MVVVKFKLLHKPGKLSALDAGSIVRIFLLICLLKRNKKNLSILMLALVGNLTISSGMRALLNQL